MQFEIRAIYIGRNESTDTTSVEFDTSKPNLLQSNGERGKSALLHIVDYCLGKSKSDIPKVDEFKKIDRVGISITLNAKSLIIGRYTSPRLSEYLYVSRYDQFDTLFSIGNSLNVDEFLSFMHDAMGFSGVVGLTALSSNRRPASVTMRNWARYIFLLDEKVLSSGSFVHGYGDRPSDTWSIREDFPYFSGAYGDDPLLVSENLVSYYQKRQSYSFSSASFWRDTVARWAAKWDDLSPQIYDVLDGKNGISVPGMKKTSSIHELIGFLDKFETWSDEILMSVGDLTTSVREFSALEDSLDNARAELETSGSNLQEHRRRRGELRTELRRLQMKRRLPEEIERLSIGFRESVGSFPVTEGQINCPTCGTAHESPSFLSEQEIDALNGIATSHTRSIEFFENAVEEADARYRSAVEDFELVAEGVRRRERTLEIARSTEGDLEIRSNILTRGSALRAEGRAMRAQMAESLEAVEDSEDSSMAEDEYKESIIAERNLRAEALCDDACAIYRDLGGSKPITDIHIDFRTMQLKFDYDGEVALSLSDIGASTNFMRLKVAILLAIASSGKSPGVRFGSFLLMDQLSQPWFADNVNHSDDKSLAEEFFTRLFEVSAERGVQLILVDHFIESSSIDADFCGIQWRGIDGLVPREWL